jgi:catechol 2,3-dioxygenase
MAAISHLGHVELVVPDVVASTEFFVELMGLQVSEEDGDRVYLRAWQDFDHHTLLLTEGPEAQMGHIGWRVAEKADAEAIAAEVERRGGDTTWSEPLSNGHGDSVRFRTPHGLPMELYWEVEKYVAPPHLRSRYPAHPSKRPTKGAGARRFDHVTCNVPDIRLEQEWLTEVLGLHHRYYAMHPDGSGKRWGSWLSRTNIAHELGLGTLEGHEGALHHFAYYLESPDDIIRTASMLVDHDVEIQFGPANHGTSGATCLYFLEPGGHRMELWTSGIMMFAPDWEAIEWGPELFGSVGDQWGRTIPSEGFFTSTPVAPELVPAKG